MNEILNQKRKISGEKQKSGFNKYNYTKNYNHYSGLICPWAYLSNRVDFPT